MPGKGDSRALGRILCATDFSAGAAAALELAVGLARPRHAEIRIIHVRPAPWPAGRPMAGLVHPPASDEKTQAELVEDLDRWRQPAAVAGVTTEAVLREGDPADEIVREAKQSMADLVVMGRHSQGPSNPWILGSVAERVLRHASCPVLVVRPFAPPGEGRPPRVLCALDLGQTAAATLKHAVALANAMEAGLIVLHVIADGQAEAARRALGAAVSRAPATKAEVHEQVARGVPYQEILAAAQEAQACLIVVGSHGGGVVTRPFLGSTTLHLLRQSECPVLVVPARVPAAPEPPEDREAPPVGRRAP